MCTRLNGEAETLDAIDRILDDYRGPKALREGIREVVSQARATRGSSRLNDDDESGPCAGICAGCPPDCDLVGDSCSCTKAGPDPGCVVHHGRRARGPKPPPLGPGCICDGSGRACPRHGVVL